MELQDRAWTEQSKDDVTVLYVDNDPKMADATARSLAEQGEDIRVVAETSPREALARVDDERYDCVVSEYRMPQMNGLELLEAIRSRFPDMPFLLFTGHGSEEIASEAISAGVTDYLPREGRGGEELKVLARQVRSAVDRRRAIERFEGFLECAPDAIVILDTDGTIEQVNSKVEELFGHERTDLLGEPMSVLLPETYRDSHVTHPEKFVDDPGMRAAVEDMECYGRRRDGTEFPIDISVSPLQVGGRHEVILAIRDITARKEREEELRERERQLQRQNQRLNEFASVVSHDLRNPMTVAEGNIQMARRSGDPEHLERAEEALDRMRSLVEDLLRLAREGMSVEDLVDVSLSQIAQTAWTTAETEDATLTCEVGDAVVRADMSRLRQILENLFHNAVEHGGDAASIRVGVLEDGSGFYVEDDGPGIPEDERDAVFEFGYSTGEHGTGFGLAIVKSIVDAHGWDVRIRDGEDGGTRFEITGVEWVDDPTGSAQSPDGR